METNLTKQAAEKIGSTATIIGELPDEEAQFEAACLILNSAYFYKNGFQAAQAKTSRKERM